MNLKIGCYVITYFAQLLIQTYLLGTLIIYDMSTPSYRIVFNLNFTLKVFTFIFLINLLCIRSYIVTNCSKHPPNHVFNVTPFQVEVECTTNVNNC